MDKLNQALDSFTEGLRSDPEIRLDIRNELQSHLEEKITEETAGGHSGEESIDLALQAFGSPVEVADSISAANRKRMKFRARMRLLSGALLIPAVILCAFFSLITASSFSVFSILDGGTRSPFMMFTSRMSNFEFFKGYTPEQKLILYGDRNRKTRVEQQKAIWGKFPDNKIYAANYIQVLISTGSNTNRDFILAEINRASQLEPENALYNYLATGIMLKDACKEEPLPKADNKAKQQYRFEVKDRALLEKAMREYLDGTNKKYCRSYSNDLLKEKLQIMGEVNSLSGQLEQLTVAAGTLLPQLNHYRNSAKYMPEYAGILINEGKKDEALQYLNSWKQYYQHMNADNCFLIGVLVNCAIATIDAEKLPPLYEKLGMSESAKTVAKNAPLLAKPVREWKEKIRRTDQAAYRNSAGILTGMLMPAMGREFTSEELAPERYAEYVFFQKITLALINLLLITGIISAAVVALYWRFRTGSRLLLLAPPPLTVLKITGIGVVLPCVVYFLLSQLEMFSGYNYGIPVNYPRFVAQMLLLMVIIPLLVLTLTRKYVSVRCCELGVANPPPSGKIQKIFILIGLLLIVAAAFAPLPVVTPPLRHASNPPAAIFLLIGGGVILLLVFLFRTASGLADLFAGGKFRIYHGATARMAMLTFAFAVLVLTCVFRPILDWREAEFVRKDKIVFGSPESFTRVEGDMVKELTDATNRALAEINK